MAKRFKISANIANLFWEMDFPHRIAAAAEAGFDGVEIPMPYDFPAPELRDKCFFASAPCLRIDAPPPNYTGGLPGFAALPGLEERFQKDFKRVIRHGQVLGVERIMIQGGQDDSASLDVLETNLAWAADEAPELKLLVQPLNPQDTPQSPLADLDALIETVQSVGKDNVRLAFSTWHASRSADGLAGAWRKCAPLTEHVIIGGGQASDADHRASAMFALFEIHDYSGWICADYLPTGPTLKSLSWLPK